MLDSITRQYIVLFFISFELQNKAEVVIFDPLWVPVHPNEVTQMKACWSPALAPILTWSHEAPGVGSLSTHLDMTDGF